MTILQRAAGAAVLLLLQAAAALAQDPCQDALRQAQKTYDDLGLFEDIPDQLAPCFGAKTSRAVAVQAHALLAKAYLALDEVEKARQEVSIVLRLDAEFEPGLPPRFAQLVEQVRKEEAVATVQVASVSKTKESLREAPATVMVITGEEIARRGYLDLEQVLHDLPGFDISRLNGDIYSFIYQRGYRSRYNDRNLLLVDGVEQNGLASNTLYLSRQYPLSNIDRIEVVYGPASTMYGANAYTGVINILTKDPEAFLAPNRNFGFAGQVGGGDFDTRFADVTFAGKDRGGNLAWSLTGRLHRSDELDLSPYPDWDYRYDDIDYKQKLRLTDDLAELFSSLHPCGETSSPFFECGVDDEGDRTIELTDEGERLVRELDLRLLQGDDVRFSDQTENWFLHGKLRLSNLILGIQMMSTEEGASSWLTDKAFAGRAVWKPLQTLAYLRYSQSVGRDLTFNLFTRFQQSGVDRPDSRYVFFHNYADGFLNMFSLAPPCRSAVDPDPIGCPAESWAEEIASGSSSDQIRNEVSLVYEPSDGLNVLAGLELSKASIQSNPDQISTSLVGVQENSPVQSEHTDAALYAQASYKPTKELKLVLAGRLHHNEIENRHSSSGFGTLFIPRAAVIYMPGNNLVFKAIYSEAFKDPTDYEKFGTVQYVREVSNPDLRPERVSNFEVNAGWQPTDALSFEVAAYQAHYTEIVALRRVPPPDCIQPLGCFQLQNRDELLIRGIQATAQRRAGWTNLFGNYTYTRPFQIDPENMRGAPLLNPEGNRVEELRIGDIASHRINLGLDVDWPGKLKTDLRLRYVGSRPTGSATTASDNPFDRIDAYTTAEATVSYEDILPGTSLQLIVNNLLDEQYYHPGTQVETAKAPRVPQPGRAIYLRIVYGFPGRSKAVPQGAASGGSSLW